MAQDIRNPHKLPEDLYPAEQKLVECMAKGYPLRIGDGERPNAIIKDKQGIPVNVIRAEVIRFFACGGNDYNPIAGHMISISGAWITGGRWLHLMYEHVPYSLELTRCHITVEMWLQHVKCREIILSGSLLEHGMNATGLQVEGQVVLRKVISRKTVELSHASIGINLDCDGGRFAKTESEGIAQSVSDYALCADRIKVSGGVFLRGDFCAKGRVSMLGANIGGSVECKNSKFYAAHKMGMALNVQDANIDDLLFLKGIKGHGMIDMTNAKAKSLYIKTNWEQFEVVLDGFEYGRIVNLLTIEDHIFWLGKRPEWLPFSPRPYTQMAKALSVMDHADDARKILLEKERLLTQDARTSKLIRVLRRMWDAFAGYGYKPVNTLKWVVFFVALGTAFFGMGASCGKIVPHQPAIVASDDYRDALKNGLPIDAVHQAFPGEYPEFDALAYSLDVFIPFFALHQEQFWAPASSNPDGTSKSWQHMLKSGWLMLFLLVTLIAMVIKFTAHKDLWRKIIFASAAFLASTTLMLVFPGLVLGVYEVGWAVAGYYLIFWLLDWRWLTAWYWFEILAGWALTSIALLSITALLRPRKLAESDG